MRLQHLTPILPAVAADLGGFDQVMEFSVSPGRRRAGDISLGQPEPRAAASPPVGSRDVLVLSFRQYFYVS